MEMKRIALLALAGLFALTSCCNSDKPVKKDISVQLYSIRDVIGNPELYAQKHSRLLRRWVTLRLKPHAIQMENSMV